jgi:hypothetical protein
MYLVDIVMWVHSTLMYMEILQDMQYMLLHYQLNTYQRNMQLGWRSLLDIGNLQDIVNIELLVLMNRYLQHIPQVELMVSDMKIQQYKVYMLLNHRENNNQTNMLSVLLWYMMNLQHIVYIQLHHPHYTNLMDMLQVQHWL